jgi:CheY-like chemotaxis protein
MTLKDRRVLVVEDDTMISMMVENMLDDLGCLVVGPAAGLAEALALASGEVSIDAALLDVNLGGQSVFPVADRLRARGVPMVFTTGYGDDALREADKDCAILRKPYRVNDLAAAMSVALGLG